MESLGVIGKFFRVIYQQFFLRFSMRIRDPYLIRIDGIYNDEVTSELKLSYHIANKRVNENCTVVEFVKTEMIYLVDPRVVFEMGSQYGSHTEKLILKKKNGNIKKKSFGGLKRVFIDE